MRVYVSGPISSETNVNRAERKARFNRCEAWIRANIPEWDIVNPTSLTACDSKWCGIDDGHSWQCWLKYDLIALLECDAIAFLPEYEISKGAQLELLVAEAMGLKQYFANSEGKLSTTKWS